jgi:hypothetical protein
MPHHHLGDNTSLVTKELQTPLLTPTKALILGLHDNNPTCNCNATNSHNSYMTVQNLQNITILQADLRKVSLYYLQHLKIASSVTQAHKGTHTNSIKEVYLNGVIDRTRAIPR